MMAIRSRIQEFIAPLTTQILVARMITLPTVLFVIALISNKIKTRIDKNLVRI